MPECRCSLWLVGSLGTACSFERCLPTIDFILLGFGGASLIKVSRTVWLEYCCIEESGSDGQATMTAAMAQDLCLYDYTYQPWEVSASTISVPGAAAKVKEATQWTG